jgi:hypothetical protein
MVMGEVSQVFLHYQYLIQIDNIGVAIGKQT